MDRWSWASAAAGSRFPRRRGDGPDVGGRQLGLVEFPPQARGWTQRDRGGHHDAEVSPAGAGMDPWSFSCGWRSGCFPRRRGDGPHHPHDPRETTRFPPQARGWTPLPAPMIRYRFVSPAGAGMDRSKGTQVCLVVRFPRRRGDGPLFGASSPAVPGFPPQARGWTLDEPEAVGDPGVSPAGAGMDPGSRRTPPASGRFPRRRGDGPDRWRGACICESFPPQARGWTVAAVHGAVRLQVSPAGAGMDRMRRRRPHPRRRFPRRRGDGPQVVVEVVAVIGFPPQARGWTLNRRRKASRVVVSPAGAGMDRRQVVSLEIAGCFPRRRGDGPGPVGAAERLVEFPPQARGWTAGVDDLPGCPGVSPAGAGMDPDPGVEAGVGRRFPRRRGDGPQGCPSGVLLP